MNRNEFLKTVREVGFDNRNAAQWFDEMQQERPFEIHYVEKKRVQDHNELFERDLGLLGMRWKEECYFEGNCIGWVAKYRIGFLENVYKTNYGGEFQIWETAVSSLLKNRKEGKQDEDRNNHRLWSIGRWLRRRSSIQSDR